MSTRALAWALEQQLPAIKKMVLVVLADHHNHETGQCNPAVKTICTEAGVGERTVETTISALVEMRLLDVTKNYRADGSRTANQYNLAVGSVYVSPGGAADAPGSVYVSPGGAADAPGGATDAGQEPGIEPVREPEPEVTSANAPVTSGGAKAKKPKRVTEVTPEFREKMREKYPSLSAVDERIDEALAHKSAKKWTDMQQYVNGWLRRDAERTNGARASPSQSRLPGADRYQKLAEQAERLQDERKRRKAGESGQHPEAENGGERPP